MWKVGAFYFLSQLSFAFYFLALTEYISNSDGKLNLSERLFIPGLCHFPYRTRVSPPHPKCVKLLPP